LQRSAVLGTIYDPALSFAKSAILAVYLRLFIVIGWMRWSCYIGIGFLFCAYWNLVPVSVIYNFLHGGKKWNLAMTADSAPAQILFLVLAIISDVSDLFIFIFTSPVLAKTARLLAKENRSFLDVFNCHYVCVLDGTRSVDVLTGFAQGS
jgi:hypothetical protein